MKIKNNVIIIKLKYNMKKANPFLANFYKHGEREFTHDHEQVYNAFLAMSFLIIPFCIIRTNRKIKTIIDPEINNSYCVISVAMLIVLKYSLWLLLISNILMLILLIKEFEIEIYSLTYKILWIFVEIPSFGATSILYL